MAKENLNEIIGEKFLDYLKSNNYITIPANKIKPHNISGYERAIGKYFDTFLTSVFRMDGSHEPIKFKESTPANQLVPYSKITKRDSLGRQLESSELRDGYGILDNACALAERDGYSALTSVLEESYGEYMDYLNKRDNRLSNVKILARKLKRNLEYKL